MGSRMDKFLVAFDRLGETAARRSAQRFGRRNVLGYLGSALAGGAMLPMLPFDRSGGQGGSRHGQGRWRRDLRILALLRPRRVFVHLLRRLAQLLPARVGGLAGDLGRNLPESGGRKGLHHQL